MYRLDARGVTRLSDGLHIDPVAADSAWQAYQDYIAGGGLPLPPLVPARWSTVAVAQAEVRAAINQERDRREASGFAYLGHVIDSDPRSAQRISLAVQAAQAALAVGAEFTVDWTCADNSVLSLAASGVLGMPVALAQSAMALHVAARSLKAWADAAAMPELLAFDVSAAFQELE